MVHHIVVFTFLADADPAAIDELHARLEALPGQIDEVRSYRVVRDLRLRDGNADLAVIAEFDDGDGFLAYVRHPAHEAVVAECLRPVVANRSSLQYAD